MKGQGKDYDRKQRQERASWRGNGEIADWGSVDPTALAGCVESVTANGWAIRFGYTRDGGAYSIGILGDGEPYTEYVRPTEDIHLALGALREWAKNSSAG